METHSRQEWILLMKADQFNTDISSGDLQTGDLLFSTHPYCNLSQAIDNVTQTAKDTHYSHVGIVEKGNDSIEVYHSSPKYGVCVEPLAQFVHPDEKMNLITVYRLKEPFRMFIPQAIELVKNLLGEEYNHSFRFTSPGYYCSELIYRIFSPGMIFDLAPMTFRNPQAAQFTDQWIGYFKNLAVPIPERQPGCNPNGLAASDKLEIIGKLKF